MKITVELDDATMAELVAVTGESKKGPAVAQAVEKFLKRKKARECGRLLMEGAFDYPVGDARGKGAAGPLSIQPLTPKSEMGIGYLPQPAGQLIVRSTKAMRF